MLEIAGCRKALSPTPVKTTLDGGDNDFHDDDDDQLFRYKKEDCFCFFMSMGANDG